MHLNACFVWKDRHLMSVDPDRNAKGSSQAKVCQFDYSFVVNEEVLGFQVTVEDSTTVTEINSFQDLVKVALKCEKKKKNNQDEEGRIKWMGFN